MLGFDINAVMLETLCQKIDTCTSVISVHEVFFVSAKRNTLFSSLVNTSDGRWSTERYPATLVRSNVEQTEANLIGTALFLVCDFL